MLKFLAMFVGLFGLWLLVSQRWATPMDWLAAGAVSAFCAVLALRVGGAPAAFARAPRALLATLRRAGAVFAGGLATVRCAAAADVALEPGLVRVRARAQDRDARAAFADLVTATPGLAVVETDAEGLMTHALLESKADAGDLARIERLVAPVQGA